MKVWSLSTGYYGTSQSETFQEDSSSGTDYLSEVCRQWEAEANKAKVERVVILRNGKLQTSIQPFLSESQYFGKETDALNRADADIQE